MKFTHFMDFMAGVGLCGVGILGVSALFNVLDAATPAVERKKATTKPITIEEQKKSKSKSTKFKESIRKADLIVRRFKEERGVPGISVGVLVNGKVVWKTGYGYSDLENMLPTTGDSAMRIASISKPLTMTLVAKLMQDGRLDLDAPIQKYVPSFPEKECDGEKVTITTRQLVSHFGGIRHYEKAEKTSETELLATATTMPPDAIDQKKRAEAEEAKKPLSAGNKPTQVVAQPAAAKTLCLLCERKRQASEFEHAEYYSRKQYKSIEEALSMFKDDALLAKPGTKYIYTTHGWTLLSAVIEGASGDGKKFANMYKDLFAMMNMRGTYLDENGPIMPNRASYYRRDPTHRLENVPSVDNSYKWAAGGVVSTVGDLLSFSNAMLYFYRHCPAGARSSDCYLDRRTVSTIWTPVENATTNPKSPIKDRYAMGWTIKPDSRLVGNNDGSARFYAMHGGGAVGASSMLALKPAAGESHEGQGGDGVAVAILTNLQECGGLRDLACSILDTFAAGY